MGLIQTGLPRFCIVFKFVSVGFSFAIPFGIYCLFSEVK